MSSNPKVHWHHKMIRKWSKAALWIKRNLSCHRTSQKLSLKTNIRKNPRPLRRTSKSWPLKIYNRQCLFNCSKPKLSLPSFYHPPVTRPRTKISKRKTFIIESTCRKGLALITTSPGLCKLLTSSIRKSLRPLIATAAMMKAPLPQNGTFKMSWSSKRNQNFKYSRKRSRKMLMRSSAIIFWTLFHVWVLKKILSRSIQSMKYPELLSIFWKKRNWTGRIEPEKLEVRQAIQIVRVV